MRFNRLASLAKIILLVAICLSTTQGLAQSTTNLVAHYIDDSPAEDGVSYNVDVYLSVLNETGDPIADLKKEDFAIQEDGQKVEVQNLRVINEEPLNIVLVMDVSSKMTEQDMNDMKSAATTFIEGLKPNDQIGLVIFNSIVKDLGTLTTDHNQITEKIKILARGDAGACIYDALDSATRMFSTTQPGGSRAVILLTKNSKDRLISPSSLCGGAQKADEVVSKASKSELRTPIYVYGLDLEEPKEDASDSEKKDFETLTGFASKTGGLFEKVANSSQLLKTFNTLSTQLRSQYILTYNSISKPGGHSLIVSINEPGQPTALDTDTRDFSLAPLPLHVAFTSPLDGDTINDVLRIAISLTTQQGGVAVERVAFEVNGAIAGEDDTKPYELELDAKQYPIGHMVVSARAYGANNTELAHTSINITRAEIVETPAVVLTEAVDAPVSVETSVPATTTDNNNSVVFMAIALGALSIVAIGILIFFLLRQQKQASFLDVDNFPDDDSTMPAIKNVPAYRKVEENRKAGSLELESDALGALTIEASDDASLVGHRFEITTPLVTLGRSADNDINFPNDKPVSRHHAEIYQISGKLYLREVAMADASGTAQPPKYGTFLNQAPMGADPALLKTGDEIQLGKRVRLKFESFSHAMDADSLTYDEDDDLTAADDMDKTSIQD